MYLVTSGASLKIITEEQFYLSSRANISIEESNLLPDFEREAFLNLVIQDIRNKTENLKASRM